MPKKKKTPAVDPHEGRPTGNLTLGDFITVKVSQSQARKENAPLQQNQQQQQQQPQQPLQVQQQQPQQPQQSAISELEPTPSEATSYAAGLTQDLSVPTSDIEELTIGGTEANSSTPEGASSAASLQPVDTVAAATAPSYFVCRTKKGGLPVKVENRSSGKKVTLVEHVVGDGKALVQVLKGKFGTGGLFRDGVVELQGDCLTKVTKYFNGNKKLLRPYGTTS